MNLTTLKTVINNEQNRSYMSYKSNGLPLTCFTCFWYVHVTHFIHDCWYFMVSLDLIWQKNLLYRSVVIRGLVCPLSLFIYFCFFIFFCLFSLFSFVVEIYIRAHFKHCLQYCIYQTWCYFNLWFLPAGVIFCQKKNSYASLPIF